MQPSLALAAISAALLLSACATSPTYSQQALPAPVQVPAGHTVALQTTGTGNITYECKARKDAPGQFEWTFVGRTPP